MFAFQKPPIFIWVYCHFWSTVDLLFPNDGAALSQAYYFAHALAWQPTLPQLRLLEILIFCIQKISGLSWTTKQWSSLFCMGFEIVLRQRVAACISVLDWDSNGLGPESCCCGGKTSEQLATWLRWRLERSKAFTVVCSLTAKWLFLLQIENTVH